MQVKGTQQVERNEDGIPVLWLSNPRNKPYWDYYPGWIGSDGTLHAVEYHSSIKAPGFTAANRQYQKAERARRREQGRTWRAPAYTPGTLSTYNHAWDRGFLRLAVKPHNEILAEYSAYRGVGEAGAPLDQVLTPLLAGALVRLCQATKSDFRLASGGNDGYKHAHVPHSRLHSADDILKEVPR